MSIEIYELYDPKFPSLSTIITINKSKDRDIEIKSNRYSKLENKMAQEVTLKNKCDKCGHIEEVADTSAVGLTIPLNVLLKESWHASVFRKSDEIGDDRQYQILLCAKCHSELVDIVRKKKESNS